jgi:hypothetical protein
MYDKALVSGAAATMATLPTGLGAVWLVIAAFALLMASGALLRIAPRRHA